MAPTKWDPTRTSSYDRLRWMRTTRSTSTAQRVITAAAADLGEATNVTNRALGIGLSSRSSRWRGCVPAGWRRASQDHLVGAYERTDAAVLAGAFGAGQAGEGFRDGHLRLRRGRLGPSGSGREDCSHHAVASPTSVRQPSDPTQPLSLVVGAEDGAKDAGNRPSRPTCATPATGAFTARGRRLSLLQPRALESLGFILRTTLSTWRYQW